MSLDVQESGLLAFLARRADSAYFAKAIELRTEVARWLAFTTASFTHYTAHTVEHSDEIIRQMSNLLFDPAEPSRPVVDLSAVEAYVLCAAALLHDTGMVVSDADLREILESDAWATWLEKEPSAQRRLSEIEALRVEGELDPFLRHLLADRQMRYLMLDFVRRSHHRRSATFLRENQAALGRFAFDDPILERTIASVCAAHGLDAFELEDRDDFPEQRDIRGEKINVRFCALLLRLGDLLDMSHDRACPLLLNAASPLPADSLAHWTQYQRIIHRETDPARIELTAECETQDEHRYLHDWCSWLVREVGVARGMMSHAARHAQWTAPLASIAPEGTIVIRPSPRAAYVAVDWQLQLDTEAVFQRLIHDVNREPGAFLRELLQNALDATRCHMYDRMVAMGKAPPAYPNEASDEWTAQFPIYVSRATTTRFSELSQEEEQREVIVVEDLGIGMDHETILRYLLQVGRSYYTSEDFRKRYPFVPTSRFGVGFLSVFDSAEEVRIETRRASLPEDDAIALTLTGPRSYVLTERIRRAAAGTRIELTLKRPLEENLRGLIAQWCRQVEFPIFVHEGSATHEIRRERPEQFCYEEASAIDEDEVMGVRAFPVATEGVTGEIYVFFRRNAKGERWTDHTWATYTYPTRHPAAREPRLPPPLICLHGIAISEIEAYRHSGFSARLDYRRNLPGLSLSRERLALGFEDKLGLDDPHLRPTLVRLLREHIDQTGHARGETGWKYKQRLLRLTEAALQDLWVDEPNLLRIMVEGEEELWSLREARDQDPIRVLMRLLPVSAWPREQPTDAEPPSFPGTVFNGDDVAWWASAASKFVFSRRLVQEFEWVDDRYLLVTWGRGGGRRLSFGYGGQFADAVDVPDNDGSRYVSIRLHKAFDETYDHAVLNTKHDFVKWVLAVNDAAYADPPRVAMEQWIALSRLLADPIWYPGLHVDDLNAFVEKWRSLKIAHLTPPEVPLSRASFRTASAR